MVTLPLAPRTARAIDLAIGERSERPLSTAADGRRLDRHGAARVVRRVTRRAQIAKHVTPHTLRHALITVSSDAGVDKAPSASASPWPGDPARARCCSALMPTPR